MEERRVGHHTANEVIMKLVWQDISESARNVWPLVHCAETGNRVRGEVQRLYTCLHHTR